jgi:hypothetical protein
MKSLGTLAAIALVGSLAACAAKTVKRDPYADAASAKRSEIDRLSVQIAQLRANPDTSMVAHRIDSLEAVRSIAQASLGGISGVVVEEQKRQKDNLQGAGIFQPVSDSATNKKYPIKKP